MKPKLIYRIHSHISRGFSIVIKILSERWKNAGINIGDTILIHSDLIRTIAHFLKRGYTITPQVILDSFLDSVGSSGTLLLPLFNFDFTKGVPFDIRITPSHMGVLSEAARLHPDAVRTGHPIYSFVVIGKNAYRFKGVNNYSGYGDDSPFALLKMLDGKIAVLDLPDQNSMTFYHYVEEMNNVPYRFHKKFTGEYTDWDGITSQRTYGLFVRDIEKGVVSHLDPAGELLWKNGLYKGDRPKINSGLRIISAREMYTFVNEIIVSGKAKGLLYKIEGDNEDDPGR